MSSSQPLFPYFITTVIVYAGGEEIARTRIYLQNFSKVPDSGAAPPRMTAALSKLNYGYWATFRGNGNKGDRKANRSKAASGTEGRAYNREASGEVNGEQSLIAVMPPAICGRIFKHSRSLVVVE
jgi:hypothetical protein